MRRTTPPNRLAELRGTQRRHELATELGVDPSTLWRWETGRTEIPLKWARALAAHYDVTLDYLLGIDMPAGAAA